MYTVTPRERVFTLAGVLVALFLAALDQTIVATAMPRILQELNGLALYTWVVTGYLLASTAMIPIWGKISDLYGRKVVVLIAVVLFLAGSALSGQARSMVELIVFRAIQGLGSAGIFSTTFTVVADLFTPAERGRYQGLFGAVFGTSSVLGPWLGGLLTDHLSWRWVFYVNVPVGLIALAFIIIQMPPLKPKLERKVSIDWGGSLLLLVSVVPLLLALSLGGQEYPWRSVPIIGLFALAVVGAAGFILAERRAAEPIIPFDLFQNRTFVIGNAAGLLIGGAAFFGAIIFLPIYMVIVVGVSASAAGLTLIPMTLAQVVSSFVSGQLVSRLGGRYKWFLLGGAALLALGYLLMQGLSPQSTRLAVSWRMVILGLGLGPALPLFTLAVQNSVHPREMGAATSSTQFFRSIGATIGVAVFGTILAGVLTAQLPRYLPPGMRGAGVGAISMGQLESGNLASVGDQIRARMDGLYAKVEAALRGDEAARQSLLADPLVPEEVRQMLLQAPAKAQGGAGLQQTLASLRAGMDRAARVLATQVGDALRRAFTDAVHRVYFWGLFVVLTGLVITLFLPELTLRKTHEHAGPRQGRGEEDGAGGEQTVGPAEETSGPVPARSEE